MTRLLRFAAPVLIAVACASTSGQQRHDAPPEAVEAVVADPATERAVVAALDDIALGRGEYHKRLAVPFMIGPGLWGEMLKLDPTLATLGTESISVVPTGGGTQTWKMGGFLDEQAVEKIGHHIKLRAVAEAFRGRPARPATSQERKLFYALTPLEIAGKPLTILSVPPDHRLAVYAEEGRLVWMDLLSAYSASLK
jgi:hypothetical protein